MENVPSVQSTKIFLTVKKKRLFPSPPPTPRVILAKKLNVLLKMLVAIHREREPFQLPPEMHTLRFCLCFESACISTEKPGASSLDQGQLFYPATFGREMRVSNSLKILRITQSWNGCRHLKSDTLASLPS